MRRRAATPTLPAAAPGEPLPRFETPIVPHGTIAGRALVAVVAIMTFLASLTTGAVMLVRAAAERLAVGGGARGHDPGPAAVSGRDIEADVAKAVDDRARAVPASPTCAPTRKAELARLLEPWLGTGLRSTICRCRASIVVRLEPGPTPTSPSLRSARGAQVPSASLDDHRSFVDRMRAMAQRRRVRRRSRCWRWC